MLDLLFCNVIAPRHSPAHMIRVSHRVVRTLATVTLLGSQFQNGGVSANCVREYVCICYMPEHSHSKSKRGTWVSNKAERNHDNCELLSQHSNDSPNAPFTFPIYGILQCT